jgi:hypothetical protein
MATITVTVEKCSIEGCDKPATGKGYCASHYRRFTQYGDPLHTKRQFHGIPTKVVGISLPVALIEAAEKEIDAEKGEKAVTVLARLLVESSWGKKTLNEAGVDMKNAGAVIVPRKSSDATAEKKPRKRKAKKEESA